MAVQAIVIAVILILTDVGARPTPHLRSTRHDLSYSVRCTFGTAGGLDNMVWPRGATNDSNQNMAIPTNLGNCTASSTTCVMQPVGCNGLWTCCAQGIGWFSPGVEPNPIRLDKVESASMYVTSNATISML